MFHNTAAKDVEKIIYGFLSFLSVWCSEDKLL